MHVAPPAVLYMPDMNTVAERAELSAFFLEDLLLPPGHDVG